MVDLTTGGTTGHPSRRQKHVPYVLRQTFTGAAAAAAKGSGLAATDVIQCLDLPADTVVLGAGIDVTTADTGTTLTFDLGITGGDVDQFVDGADATTAAHYGSPALGAANAHVAAADTLDILIVTESAAEDDWVVDVWALLVDVSAYPTVQSAQESQGVTNA